MSGIERWASGAVAALLKEQVSSCWIRRRLDSVRLLFCGYLTRMAESVHGGAVSVGKGAQKHSGFGRFLRNEECAAAGQDLAEHDLQDQQVTSRSAHELIVAQASKRLVCPKSIRSRRRIAREQPCRHPEGDTRRVNRMRATRHRSPTLRTPAGYRREMHPPACLGQGSGHPPRTGIWDAAPNRGRLIRCNRFYCSHRGRPPSQMIHLTHCPRRRATALPLRPSQYPSPPAFWRPGHLMALWATTTTIYRSCQSRCVE